jgi:hypothetical protein
MTAATLRQTAAPVANVKSEIHMRDSLVLLVRRDRCLERAVNAAQARPFPELGASDCIKIPFCDQKDGISTLGL